MYRKTDQPVTERKTLVQVAYERIKDDIISGAFSPGDSIPVVQIANRLQISPMPIRGALARLEVERWVEIIPQRGVFVSKMTIEELRENFVVRSRLEGLGANLSCAYMAEAEISKLRRLLEEMHGLAAGNSRRLWGVHTEFHETIIKCSQNATLIRLVIDLRERSVRMRPLLTHVPGHMVRREPEHERIVEAIAMKDGDLAERCMREHLLTAGAELIDYLLKTSDHDALPTPDRSH